MAKCIVCGFPVTETEIKECEKEGTYGVYCSQHLVKKDENTANLQQENTQLKQELRESYKAIVTYCTYIEDEERYCDVCGSMLSGGHTHKDNCIVLKAEKFLEGKGYV